MDDSQRERYVAIVLNPGFAVKPRGPTSAGEIELPSLRPATGPESAAVVADPNRQQRPLLDLGVVRRSNVPGDPKGRSRRVVPRIVAS
jgi:hypothetical protein